MNNEIPYELEYTIDNLVEDYPDCEFSIYRETDDSSFEPRWRVEMDESYIVRITETLIEDLRIMEDIHGVDAVDELTEAIKYEITRNKK